MLRSLSSSIKNNCRHTMALMKPEGPKSHGNREERNQSCSENIKGYVESGQES